MNTDPVTTMINECHSACSLIEACHVVEARVRTGKADSTVVYHLMARAFVLLSAPRFKGLTEAYEDVIAAVNRVLNTEPVGESTV